LQHFLARHALVQCFLHIPHGEAGIGIGIGGAQPAAIGAHPAGICGAQAAPMQPAAGGIGAHPGCGAHDGIGGIGGAQPAGMGAHPIGICGAQAAPMQPAGGGIGAHPGAGIHGSIGAQDGAGIQSASAPGGGHSSQAGFGGGGGGGFGGGAIPKNCR